ncbi:MAG: DNA translocase FtsK [Clostridiales bacterium]|nr:DNA translocase FtsK [Clostridiales bacterium]
MAGSSKKKASKKPTKKETVEKPGKENSVSTEKKPQSEFASKQVSAVALVAAGVLIAFINFFEFEKAWAFLHFGMFRIFGVCAYLVPLMLIYLGFVTAKGEGISSVAGNLVMFVILFLLVSGAVHVFGRNAEYFESYNLTQQIEDAWNSDYILSNGGIFGAVVGGLLSAVFGVRGTKIILVILIIVAAMLVSGTTLSKLIYYIVRPIKKAGQATSERIENSSKNAEKRHIDNEQKRQRKQEIKEAEKIAQPGSRKKVPDLLIPVENSGEGLPVSITIPKPGEVSSVQVSSAENGDSEPTVQQEAGKKGADGNSPEIPARKGRKKSKAIPDSNTENEELLPDIPTFHISSDIGTTVYTLPSIECLKKIPVSTAVDSMSEMNKSADKLIDTLESFKIKAEITNIVRGPSVTRFELVPDAGVRINRITALSDDIALRLAAKSVRIEAPIPGKSAIGIEVPNSNKAMVSIREIIDTTEYRTKANKSKLNVALGKDITGNIICADLAKMPHLLVAGTTGSGKSVCLNSMIVSILYNATPDEVKLLMIDPKMVEFTVYNGIAHLEIPVVSNPRKAAAALSWAVSEMERRYKQFSDNSVRDIEGYNRLCNDKLGPEKMHQIVIFIDELSDLMMSCPKEVEDSICRLAQMARAAGIHLVIATQRPSVDVITGIIKANIPSRIALSVSSATDSRTILDRSGAEKLLGNGDMLFNPVGASKPTRLQGCYISDADVEKVVHHVKSQMTSSYDDEIMKEIENKAATAGKKQDDDDDDNNDRDPMFDKAVEVVVTAGQASTTMLQKKLKLGYARASRVMDQLEESGIVGPSDGAKPREVKLTKQEWYERRALSESYEPSQTVFDDEIPGEDTATQVDMDFSFDDDDADESIEEFDGDF